jgi:EpsD family peptidyl-prolyl cis-trans isomerase
MFSLSTVNLWASEIVAIVNGKEISQQDINNFILINMPGSHYNFLSKDEKKSILEQMIDRKLFAEEAKRLHIENSLEFQIALEKARDKLLVDYWMKEKAEQIVISDKEAKAYYENNLDKFYKDASVKVRHILVKTKAEANEIIDELMMNKATLKETFIKLAKRKSIGPSAINGGELDWFIQEQMVPEFSDAAFSLEVGTITTKPILTQFGYHIIYLEDKKEKGITPFKDVKKGIANKLRVLQFKKELKNMSEKMRKTAKIIVK